MMKFNSYRKLKPFVKNYRILNVFQYLSHLQSPEIQLYWEHLDNKMLNKLFGESVYKDRSKKVAASYLPNILNYIWLSKYKNFRIEVKPNADQLVTFNIKYNDNNYTTFIFNENHIVNVEYKGEDLSTKFSICASDKIVNKWKIERCFPLCLGVLN